MNGLNLPDLLVLQVLRRAGRGVMTWRGGRFFDDGHLVGMLRSEVLDALTRQGLLRLSAPGGDGAEQVGVTEAGRGRYVELGRLQRRCGFPVAPERHPIPQSPADHRLSDPRLRLPVIGRTQARRWAGESGRVRADGAAPGQRGRSDHG